MAWTVFRVPTAQRSPLEEALRDDVVARQSHKVRDAAVYGGPSGELYVQVEGSAGAISRAESLLGPIGTKLTGADADRLRARFLEEDETAAAGMGLLFTE